MTEPSRVGRFEAIVMPHLKAAYRLARWLVRDDETARDLVQDACLSAFESIARFRGESGKAWILTIVRHACYRRLRRDRRRPATEELDEAALGPNEDDLATDRSRDDPETWLLRDESRQRVGRALESLPPEFREIIVLRELEGYSYREIAEIAAIPPGTVMSRLARARALLWKRLADESEESRCVATTPES